MNLLFLNEASMFLFGVQYHKSLGEKHVRSVAAQAAWKYSSCPTKKIETVTTNQRCLQRRVDVLNKKQQLTLSITLEYWIFHSLLAKATHFHLWWQQRTFGFLSMTLSKLYLDGSLKPKACLHVRLGICRTQCHSHLMSKWYYYMYVICVYLDKLTEQYSINTVAKLLTFVSFLRNN